MFKTKIPALLIREDGNGKERVGMTGFEPATTWSQTRSATGLRYIP